MQRGVVSWVTREAVEEAEKRAIRLDVRRLRLCSVGSRLRRRMEGQTRQLERVEQPETCWREG